MTDDIIAMRKQRGELATAQQRRAADPARSVWVEASAGTGKTKVLSDRVLRLLLNGVPPGRILCLTYTKAAAVEMSSRIAGRLSRWAVTGDDDLQNFWGACRRNIKTMPGWRLRHENFLPFCWTLPAE